MQDTEAVRKSDAFHEVVRSMIKHDLSGLSAQLAFRFMHSVLWVAIFASAAIGFLAPLIGGPDPVDRLMQTLFADLPDDTRSVLAVQLHRLVGRREVFLLALGAAGSVLTGVVAIMSLMKSLNQVWEVVDDRPVTERALVGLGLSLLLGMLVLVALTLLLLHLLAGPAIAERLHIPGPLGLGMRFTALLVAVVALVVTAAVLYRVTPREDSRAAWVTAGAGVFVVVWLSATVGLALYLAHFGKYANAFGLLGALLVVFSWFYITSFALLLGAEVNVLLERRETRARSSLPGRKPAAQSETQRTP
jgi:membrane protein